jgi:D-alanine transaminase
MHTLPSFPCYLNGTYTPLCDAKISVMDRGFIFGDGVYEVVPVYAGRPFRFSQHMARLDRSLAELRIANPLTRAEWHDIATKLIAGLADHACASGLNSLNPNHLVYLQITRGVALRDHAMPQDITPTVFAMATQMNLPNASQRSQGVACVTADDFRWEKAHIKSTSLLGAVFARQIGVDAGVAETSNVWLVQDGCLIGPPKDHLVLEGIRFGLMEELCRAQGIPFTLRRIARDEVLHADELLLTSATKEVLAITTLDGQAVGNGLPGPVYAKLYAAYTAATQAL